MASDSQKLLLQAEFVGESLMLKSKTAVVKNEGKASQLDRMQPSSASYK